ncbi:SORT1 [Bugula neritina]|uniref:SORT1 n=1 Tax=Bugula neritina TaxID=10212 RepID=A0A7J7JGX9_BUGNE|nr:SORT1 [Bugula neritina]
MLAMFLMININMIRNTKCEVQTVTLAVTPTKIQNELISTFFVDNYKSKTTKENQHFLHKIVKRSPDNQLLCLPTNKLSSVPTDLFTVSTANKFDVPTNTSSDYDAITMVWTGQNNATRVVAVIDLSQRAESVIYQSQESTSSFTKSVGLKGLHVLILETNPNDTNHVIVIGRKNTSYESCISNNAGVSFICYPLPGSFAPVAGTILFRDHLVMMIMQSTDYFNDDRVLALSKDSGKTWKIVEHNVQSAVFEPTYKHSIMAMVSVENPVSIISIFGFTMDTKSQMKRIEFNDGEATTSSLLAGLGTADVTGFQYADQYLHVVTQDSDGHKLLKVSKDNGNTFTNTQLPPIDSGQYINILDVADQLIFAHISDPVDDDIGTLLTSGDDGVFYTQSMTNHIKEDFYSVMSMNGVYLTTQKQLDGSLISKISRNRGGEWEDLKLKDCLPAQDESCKIQVYNKYLITFHQESGQSKVLAQSPYSNRNARGLIIIQGIVADRIAWDSSAKNYLYESEKVLIFVSGDGGFNWVQAPSAMMGAHHVMIGDSGSIIMALPVNKELTKMHFSLDEGGCWSDLPIKIDVVDGFSIEALVSQPGLQSLKLGIVGHGSSSSGQLTWAIIDVDFSKIVSDKCKETDLDSWEDTPYCYLGEKRTYKRIKKESWCYMGANSGVSYTAETCACSRSDYECDYGYLKQTDKERTCSKDPDFKNQVTFCKNGTVYQLESSGYRKVPGDKCDASKPNSFVRDTNGKVKSLNRPCDAGDTDTYLSLETVEKKICGTSQKMVSGDDSNEHKTKGLVAVVVILTLISTALCIALGIVYMKYRRIQNQFNYGEFDNIPSSTDLAPSASSVSETVGITHGSKNGKSYSKLKDSTVELDVDLLNM